MTLKRGRRRFLKGMLGGAAVTVGLPLFDHLFDGNGAVLAAEAAAPVRFGTWFWGCGCNPDRWVPQAEGADYDLPPELAMGLEGFTDKVSVLTGFDTPLNGRNNWPHYSPPIVTLTGDSPITDESLPRATFDHDIANVIGTSTRFRTLDLAADGRARGWSASAPGAWSPVETSPAAFYQRVFGEGFQIGSEGFMPDPRVMVRKSVLSAVLEDSNRLKQELGSHDRQRLDQYFTAVRQLENQLELQLTEPPDLPSCVKPGATNAGTPSLLIEEVMTTHRLMVDMLVLALACDQTRVFNLTLWRLFSDVHYPGEEVGYHQLTHDEAVDPTLGYQPLSQRFLVRAMEGWKYLLGALNDVDEGDGTLLDHIAVFAHSGTEFPKEHGTQNIPMLLAGSASGRLNTGLHVRGGASPTSRMALTLQQVMGVPAGTWGVGEAETSSPVSELVG